MKSLSVIALSLSATFALSGCMATGLVGSWSYKEHKQHIELSDTLVAVGKPKTPINGHPDALILAGVQHNYLVEGRFKEDREEMASIFGDLDLNYVRIEKIDLAERIGQHYVADVKLRYSKPKELVSTKEYNILQKISGSNCTSREGGANTIRYECPLPLTVNINPIKKPENQVLQHRFSEPLKVEFYSKKFSKTPAILLLPLAIAVDVVTFPLQIVPVINRIPD